MNCAKCSHPNAIGTRFCAHCGAALSTDGAEPGIALAAAHATTGAAAAAAKAVRDILEKSFAKAECSMKDFSVTGKSVSYSADCGTGSSAHTLSSVAEYRGDWAAIQLTVKRTETTETMLTKGRRVGACT